MGHLYLLDYTLTHHTLISLPFSLSLNRNPHMYSIYLSLYLLFKSNRVCLGSRLLFRLELDKFPRSS